MLDQDRHAMLPEESQDEAARESFVASMRQFVVAEVYPRVERVYQERLLPQFKLQRGREPESYGEVRTLFESDSFYQGFSLVNRATQELLWDTVGESVERQLPKLIGRARKHGKAGGSLKLDPTMPLPAHIEAVDIHVMPGNYHTELAMDDVYAGALYDRGVYLYAYGGLGPRNDALGVETVRFLKSKFPSFKPRRILDLGCSVGHSTLPLAEAYPDAEVFAIDVAAPVLRYAHARAEALGRRVHFLQQDAAATDFETGYFDLVTSALLFHELPLQPIVSIIRECHRVLAPGGVMVHNDMLGWPSAPYADFMTDWNSLHNNELFSRAGGKIDFLATCVEAGFAGDEVFIGSQKAAYMEEQLEVMGLRGAVKR